MFLAVRRYLFLLVFMMAPGCVHADKPMVFSIMSGGTVAKRLIPVLTSAYAELGIEVEFKYYPASRAVKLADAGMYDGETFRGMDFINAESNLLPVMVVVAEVEWWVYSKNINFKVQGYKSLEPYHVSSRRGILAADNILKYARKKKMLNTFEQTLLMLDAGRVDLAILPARISLAILEKMPLDIYALKPAIRVDELYHFIHKKHEALIPKITKILKRMKRNGKINLFSNRFDDPQ
ncbi:MAG: transporter substrate-binding domain-containing protein [Bermanella sp.]